MPQRHGIPASMTPHVKHPPASGSVLQHVAPSVLQVLTASAQLAGPFQAALALSALPGGHMHTQSAISTPLQSKVKLWRKPDTTSS